MALRKFPVGLLVLLIAFLFGNAVKGADDKKQKKPEAGVVIDFSKWSGLITTLTM